MSDTETTSGTWVSMSRAARELRIDQSMLSRWGKKGIIQTRKSRLDARISLVNLTEIKELLAEESRLSSPEQTEVESL